MENNSAIPPPYPDETEWYQAQIDIYNLDNPPTLVEITQEWNEKHKEAWEKTGRKRPRMAWYEVDLPEDDQCHECPSLS